MRFGEHAQQLDKRNKEHNGRNHARQKPMQVDHAVGRQKLHPTVREAERKLKMSQPVFVRRTKSAMRNCVAMPTMTVCHLTARLLRLVAYSAARKTQRPKEGDGGLARLLPVESGEAMEPMMMAAITSEAASGMRRGSGHIALAWWPVCLHAKRISLDTGVIGR